MDQSRWQMGGSVQARTDPATPARLFDAALHAHQEGRFAEADGLYRRVLALDPRHADSLHLLGVVSMQMGRPDTAIELIGQAIAVTPSAAGFHSNIAEALRMLGRFDEAIRHLERAMQLEPGFADAHMNLGNVLKLQGKLDAAVAAYRQALALKQDYPEAHMNLGVALMEQGKSEEAIGQYGRALALRPDFVEAHMNLAIALQNSGRPEEAITHYERALALRPTYVAALMNFGNTLLDLGQLDDALARYEQALVISSGNTGSRVLGASPLDSIRKASNATRALLPLEEQCFMNLVRVNCWRSGARHWGELCTIALQQGGLLPPSRFELLVRAAIGQWTGDDRAGLAGTLAQAEAVSGAIGPSASRDIKNSRAYAKYLRNLLQHAAEGGPAPAADGAMPLLIIGDSHCLAYHGVAATIGGQPYVAAARLVMGCKAWHLSNSRPNLYKWLFKQLIDQVPENSPAICCFGEIDCRLDEGILPHYRKAGGDLEAIIAGQVDAFVDHVAEATAPRRLALMFMGVPAPHLDLLDPQHPDISNADKRLLIDIVRVFNRSLAKAAARRGHGVIDVFKLSAGPDGRASGERHIDDFHLKPDSLTLALS